MMDKFYWSGSYAGSGDEQGDGAAAPDTGSSHEAARQLTPAAKHAALYNA